MPGIEGRREGRPLAPKRAEVPGTFPLLPGTLLGRQRAALTAALDAGHRGPAPLPVPVDPVEEVYWFGHPLSFLYPIYLRNPCHMIYLILFDIKRYIIMLKNLSKFLFKR